MKLNSKYVDISRDLAKRYSLLSVFLVSPDSDDEISAYTSIFLPLESKVAELRLIQENHAETIPAEIERTLIKERSSFIVSQDNAAFLQSIFCPVSNWNRGTILIKIRAQDLLESSLFSDKYDPHVVSNPGALLGKKAMGYVKRRLNKGDLCYIAVPPTDGLNSSLFVFLPASHVDTLVDHIFAESLMTDTYVIEANRYIDETEGE